jgi:FtsP/CotA-like multicopper oxidase with cupredoxin domain
LFGEGHTIHLHGLDTSTEFDGVPETFEPGLVRQGSSYTYKFVAKHAGTYFYHCHQNNVEHQQMGMYGPLVVQAAGGAKAAYTNGPAFDREYTLVLSELGSDGHEGARQQVQENGDPFNWLRYNPTYYLVNSQAFAHPNQIETALAVNPGERVLLRVIDAGYGAHQVSLDGRPFSVVASDGRPWTQPRTTDSLWLGPGEKYDLLLTGDASGSIQFEDHVNGPYSGPMLGADKLPAVQSRPPSGQTQAFTLYLRDGEQTMPDGAEVYVYGLTADSSGSAQVPGPVLTVNQGDSVELTLVNDADPTGAGHGLVLPGLPADVDGPALVAPGEFGTYRFTAPGAGSYFYRGASDQDQEMGVYGALIIKPGGDQRTVYAGGPPYDQEFPLVLSEVDTSAHAAVQQTGDVLQSADASEARTRGERGPYLPDYFLINGLAYPDEPTDASAAIRPTPGDRVLLRTINAGLEPHAMHLHGYHFQVVARAGQPWANGPLKDTILIAPGEAYDLLFVADQSGLFPFHDHYEFNNTNAGVWLGGMLTTVLCSIPQASAQETVPAQSSRAPTLDGPTVAIKDNFYTPNILRVTAGTTVHWDHQGKVEHTITSQSGYFDSGSLNNGETFSYTFPQPGRYDYFCRFHFTARGVIIVQ